MEKKKQPSKKSKWLKKIQAAVNIGAIAADVLLKDPGKRALAQEAKDGADVAISIINNGDK